MNTTGVREVARDHKDKPPPCRIVAGCLNPAAGRATNGAVAIDACAEHGPEWAAERSGTFTEFPRWTAFVKPAERAA